MTTSSPSDSAPTASALALPPGSALQEFRVLSVIGEGGFGIVYLAEDTLLGRRVAVKEYMPTQLAARAGGRTVRVRSDEHAEAFDAGRRSFINEARMLAQFKHRSLVEVFRYWEENGTAYMAMPFYNGPTMRTAIGNRAESVDQIWLARILLPLMDALEHMHRANVYHRDIAPDNILLLGEDYPVLLDLGAARHIIGNVTQAVTVMLKPGYAPIEQYSDGDPTRQGPWTDVYALGAVIYFAIQRKSPIASISRLEKDALPSLAALAPRGFTDQFLQAVDWALRPRPEDRPQSIAAFRDALGIQMEVAAVTDGRGPGERNDLLDPLEALAQVAQRRNTGDRTTTSRTASAATAAAITASTTGAKAAATAPAAAEPIAVAPIATLPAATRVIPLDPPSAALESGLATIPPTRLEQPRYVPTPAAAAAGLAPTRVLPVAIAPPLTSSVSPPSAVTPPLPKPRPPLLAIIGGLAAIAAATTIVWLVARPGETPPGPLPNPVAQRPVPTSPEIPPPVPGLSSTRPAAGDPQTVPATPLPSDQSATPPAVGAAPPIAGAASPAAGAAPPAAGAAPPTDKPDAPTAAANKPAADSTAAGTTGTVNVNVRPWGEVFVNGAARGVSPPLRQLPLAPGTYSIELRNPASPPLVRQVVVRAGQSIDLNHEFQ